MTPYSKVFDSFKDLIIRDTTFFINNPNQDIVLKVSEDRMLKLLSHAITNIVLVRDSRNFQINFMEIRDDMNMQFTEMLTDIEIDLLAYFMWQCYIDEEFTLRFKELRRMGFSDKEITIFSPANTLKEFTSCVATLKSENTQRVIEYKRRDRKNLSLKGYKFNVEG